MHRLLSLRGKMLIFTLSIVVVLVGLSLAVIHEFVAGQVQKQVGEDLEKTQSVFGALMQERAHWLRSQCEVVARDPRFIATLDIQSPDLDSQARTVIREARQFQSVLGSDLFLVTNQDGYLLARMEIAVMQDVDLDGLSSLASALTGQPTAGTWAFEEQVYRMASVPVWQDSVVIGTLNVGFAEDDVKWFLDAFAAYASEDVRLREAVLTDGQVATMAREVLSELDRDLVVITDRTGALQSLAVRRQHSAEDLSGTPRIREALSGRITSGLQVDQGRIVQMVAVPVFSQGELVGALGAGFDINDRLARDLQAMMHSEISFGVNDRVVASTWPENERARLVAQLSDAPDSNRSEPFRMMVGEETYLALMGRLEDLQGEAQGFYLIQFSLDQAIQFLTTIEQMLLLIGAGVLFTAALFSFAGVRQITRPVQALVEGTRRLAAGRLEHRIPVSSSDEIGELAGSFNDMAGSLTQSRDALEESGRRYRDLFDNAQDIVYTTDLEMRFASVNKAAIEFSGYGLDELLGKSFYDLLTPEDAQRLRKIEERYEPGAHRLPEEVEFLRKNGTRATLEIVSRWVIEGGQPIGVHGIGRDISQRKEREEAAQRFREQLHQAEKLRALGEMAAGVAHNFNNLLTGVMGYAELMKLRDDVPEPVQNNAQKIVESARRCAAIVRRIQTFGRPIDPSQRERVNLNTVIRDTVDITHAKWKSQAEREGKQVRVELELGEIPLVQSVGSAWEEILSNLIFNAVDAMPESGTITLGTRLDGEHVVVFVADTGTGMDEETQRRVFEPFFTTKSPERGTGLGLSTVWGLVQSQGGRVDIESTLGKGTTFFIRVPVADSGEADARVEAGVRVVRALRILVIDDDLMVRDFLPSLLAPHEVDAAENGPEGLTLFRRKQHDLVITDWVMSGMSGLEVAEQVKELSAHTVVVLMTGWETLGTAAENHDAVDLVVTKPFDSVKLNRALQQVAQLREQPVVGGDA